MGRNIKKALAFMKKDLEKNFSKLRFEYRLEKDVAYALESISLNGVDGVINVRLNVESDGTGFFMFGFEKSINGSDCYSLINEFNRSSDLFYISVFETNIFVLHNFLYMKEDWLKSYASEILNCFAALTDNVYFMKLMK